MPRILTGVLLGASLVPWLAHADLVTFHFTGTVTQVPIDDFATGIAFGDSITGRFTFDSTALDAIAAPTAGSYTSTGGAFGMTSTISASALLILGIELPEYRDSEQLCRSVHSHRLFADARWTSFSRTTKALHSAAMACL